MKRNAGTKHPHEKQQRDYMKGVEQLNKARHEYGSLFRDNPTHKYNPSTGMLEKCDGRAS
jgi:hypothetical protein